MSASTSRSFSSVSSSGPSTPWLSPSISSSNWRDGTQHLGSARRSQRTSTEKHDHVAAAYVPNVDPRAASHSMSQDWWEHVLPPGQLAERLRKAKRSTSASRRRNNPALANATPSERSAWKSLSGLPLDRSVSASHSPDMSASSSHRSSVWSQASLSGFRLDDNSGSNTASSADVSSDEYPSPTGSRSPEYRHQPATSTVFGLFESDSLAGPHTVHVPTSPRQSVHPWPSSQSFVSTTSFHSAPVSRSSSTRRARVRSADGMTPGTLNSTAPANVPSAPSSNASSKPLHSSTVPNSFAHRHAKRLSGQFIPHSLPGTPEVSSDDDTNSDSRSSVTTTTQHTRRVSITTTTIRSSSRMSSPPTILRSNFDRPEQPALDISDEDLPFGAGRRSRHVSFDSSAFAKGTSREGPSQDPTSVRSSQSAFDFTNLPSRDYASPFESLPGRSNSTRRPRQGTRVNGRKATSFSLPGSRRGSIHESMPYVFAGSPFEATPFAADSNFGTKPAPKSGHSSAHRRSMSVPDVALLDSLNVAQKQLASAGSLALTLTRQLSAPLRPMFHLTLFLSISSITVVSLACFLFASYALTAWDDVGKRTQKVGRAAGKTREKVETTLSWGMRMLSNPDGSEPSASATEPRRSSRRQHSESNPCGVDGQDRASQGFTKSGHVVFLPLRMALAGTGSILHRVAPASIAGLFGQSDSVHAKSSRAKNKAGKPSSLPPRPPLSTLVPSIMFTLVLAIGAGLASFFASRRAAAEAAAAAGGGAAGSTHAMPASMSSSGGDSSYGMPSAAYVHVPSASRPVSPSSSPFLGRSRFPSNDTGTKPQLRRHFDADFPASSPQTATVAAS
ncbi:hypothetical protein BCV70DRAFT_115861 [Testicularia cyperi]|uniref:Uncharacterized protein n=1 Tax=Testicularia cyperi TaxID=1882483 RepID=A0A317XLT9_9BASI|nr:hypothetical protein BCV70DRAFT_115861 [Testicularia cyperi]